MSRYDWSYAVTNQRRLEISGKPPEAGRHGTELCLTALRRNQPCQHLGLGRVASCTVRQYIAVVCATQSVVICYDSPRKLIQAGRPFPHIQLFLYDPGLTVWVL